VKKRWWLRRVWFRAMFRLGRGRDIHGVDVFAIPPGDGLLEKVGDALDLVAEYAPQSLRRLRRYGSIMVHGKGPMGAWHRGPAVVKLANHHVASASTHPTLLAATIVREVTRARLEHSRLDWAPEGPRRIEAICSRAEARFAGRLLEHRRLSSGEAT
jgi:hypothetical protein